MCIKKKDSISFDTFNEKPFVQFEKVILDKVKFGISNRISPALLKDLKVSSYIDQISNDLIIRLDGFFYQKEHSTCKVETDGFPADWWEAVKERFFPEWLLKRYPVKYLTIKTKITNFVINKCPHINTMTDKDHIEFLISKEHECRCSK